MKIKKALKKFNNAYLKNGIDVKYPDKINRHIWISNVFAFSLGIVVTPYTYIFWSDNTVFLAIGCIPQAIYYTSIPLLNRFGLINFTRLSFMVICHIAVLFYSVMLGPLSGIHLLFILTASFFILLFDTTERYKQAFSIVTTLLSISIFHIYYALGNAPPVTFSHHVTRSLSIYLFFTTFSLMMLIIYFFYYASTKAEKELSHHRDHLEELVKESTQKLEDAQAELIRKEKMAALGHVIGIVSHDLRNPLGTVRNALYTLKVYIERNNIERANQALIHAKDSLSRCDQIIEELLDLMRERKLHKRSIDIDAWLERNLKKMDIPDEIKLTMDLNCNKEALIDSDHFHRVMNNVITNAIQALEQEESKGKDLKISTSASGKQIDIKIIDNGPGIPDADFKKIFEPMFSTKRIGVGLGLPIVKDIMIEHDGGVDISSKINEGITVSLWLPLSDTGKIDEIAQTQTDSIINKI